MADIEIDAELKIDTRQAEQNLREFAAKATAEQRESQARARNALRETQLRNQQKARATVGGKTPEERAQLATNQRKYRNEMLLQQAQDRDALKADLRKRANRISNIKAAQRDNRAAMIQDQRDARQAAQQEKQLLREKQSALRAAIREQERITGQKQAQLTGGTKAVNSGRRTVNVGGQSFDVNPGMVAHSREAERSLQRLQSAAAGTMLGFGILNHNITSIGFSLIFLRFSMIPLVALFAGATVAAGILAKALGFVRGSANDAGKAMETFGQQQATFFQSAKIAQDLETEADQISKTYGIARDEAEKTAVSLQRAGINQELYQKAVLNAAAGTGQNASDVAEDLRTILESSGGATEAMVKDFAQKYQIDIRNYSDSVALATALSNRFKDGAENYAKTQAGLIGRLKAEWAGFATQVGAVVGEVYKILIKPMIAFTQALGAGFGAAKKQAEADGSLQKSLGELEGSVIRATPYLIKFGYVLGTVLFKAIMVAIHVIKTMIDAAISLWKVLKPILDWLIGAVQWLKQVIDKFLDWLGVSDGLAAAILGIVAALGLLWWFFQHDSDTTQLKNAIKDLTKEIENSKAKTDDLKQSLNELGNTHVKPSIDLDEPSVDQGKAQSWGEKLAGVLKGPISSALGGLIGGALVGAIGPELGIGLGAALMAPIEIAGTFVATQMPAIALGMLVAPFVAIALLPQFVGGLAGSIASMFINALVVVPSMIVSTIFGMVADMLGSMARAFGGIKEMVHGLITGDWGEAFHGLMDFVAGVFAMSPAGWILSLAKNLIANIPGLGPAFDLLHKAILHPFDTAAEIWDHLGGVGGALDKVRDFGAGALSWMGGWGADFAKGFMDHFDISPATDELQSLWNSGVGDFIGSWDGGGVLGGLHTVFSFFATGFSNIVSGVFAPLGAAAGADLAIAEAIIGSWDDETGAVGFIHKAFETLHDWFQNNDVFYPLRLAFDTANNTVGHLIDSIQWLIDKIPGIPGVPSWMQNAFEALHAGQVNIVNDILHSSGPMPTQQSPILGGGTNAPGLPGVGLPQTYAAGGVIPGLMGQRRLVWAEAGERFLGAPGPNADRSAAQHTGGGHMMVAFDLRGAVISGDASMNQLADKVISRLTRSLRTNRSFTYHRV